MRRIRHIKKVKTRRLLQCMLQSNNDQWLGEFNRRAFLRVHAKRRQEGAEKDASVVVAQALHEISRISEIPWGRALMAEYVGGSRSPAARFGIELDMGLDALCYDIETFLEGRPRPIWKTYGKPFLQDAFKALAQQTRNWRWGGYIEEYNRRHLDIIGNPEYTALDEPWLEEYAYEQGGVKIGPVPWRRHVPRSRFPVFGAPAERFPLKYIWPPFSLGYDTETFLLCMAGTERSADFRMDRISES